jgi:hypothetical protein
MKSNFNPPAIPASFQIALSWLGLDQQTVMNMPKKQRMLHFLERIARWLYPQERIEKLGQAGLDREIAESRREIRNRNRLFFKILTLAVSGVITAGSAHVVVKTLAPGPISLPLTIVVGGVSAFFLDQLMVIMMKKGRLRRIRQEELDSLQAQAGLGNDLAKAYYGAKIQMVMDIESHDSETSNFIDSAIAVGGLFFESGVVAMLLIPSGPLGIGVGLFFPIVFSYCGAKFDEEQFRVPEAKEILAERYAANIVKHPQFSRDEEMEIYGLESVIDHIGCGSQSMSGTPNWREALKKGMLGYLDREALRAREEHTMRVQAITEAFSQKLAEIDRKYECAAPIEIDRTGKSPEEVSNEKKFLEIKAEEDRVMQLKTEKDRLQKARESAYGQQGKNLQDLLNSLSELRELVANEDYGGDADRFDIPPQAA